MATLLLLLPLLSLATSSSLPVQRIPNSCATTDGDTCVFPFTYKGTEHSQCTYTDSPTPWCATMVDSQGSVVTHQWGDCATGPTSGCQQEELSLPSCTTEAGPRPGLPCVFPFRHLGITYTSCTSVGQTQAWCSTSTTQAGTHIQGEEGFCPSTCPGAPTDPTTTTTTTTTTPSTTTTASTTTTVPTTTTASNAASPICIPGTTFQQDCNTCVCDPLGSPICTTFPCTPSTTSTTTPSPPPTSTCQVSSGPAAGQNCVFPFTYSGVTHTNCAEWVFGGENQGKLWCSTQVDATGTHVNGAGNYGFCSATCTQVSLADILGDLLDPRQRTAGAVVFGSRKKPKVGAKRPF